MEAAVFLRESDEVSNEQWYKFSRRFFTEYRDTIIRYYGYENQLQYTPPRVVNYPQLFIAIISVLEELDFFGCKKTELVNTLYGVFCFGKERSTIRKWLYEVYPEYEVFLINFKKSFGTLKIKK